MKDTTDDVVEQFKKRYMQPGITDVRKDSDGIKVVVATPLTALNLPSCFEGIAVRPVLDKGKED